MKVKYILTIILCTFGGGISALMGGPQAIVRGAVLGGMLAISVLLVFAIQQHLKNKFIHAITIPLLGLFGGTLAGILCLKLTPLISDDSLIQTPDSLLIQTSALYGLLVTCAMAITRNRAYLSQYFAVWAAFYLVGLLRMLPEMLLGSIQAFIIISGNIPNSCLIASLFFIVFKQFILTSPSTPKSKRWQKIENKIAKLMIGIAVVTFIFILPNLAFSYRDMRQQSMNKNEALLSKLAGHIYIADSDFKLKNKKYSNLIKLFEFSEGNVKYFDIRSDYAVAVKGYHSDSAVIVCKFPTGKKCLRLKGYKDAVAISPHGKYLAMSMDTQLEIISLPEGKKVLTKKFQKNISSICWAPVPNMVVLSSNSELWGVNIEDGKILKIGKGLQPKLAIESKQIFYIKDSKLFCMPDLDYSKSKLKIKDCSFLKNRFEPENIYNVSPDGKFIVHNTKTKHMLLYPLNGYITIRPAQDNQEGLLIRDKFITNPFFPWLPSENKNKSIKLRRN